MGGILADGGDHLIEHVKALDAVEHHGVFLTVGAQVDAAAQLIHVVNVVHPVAVNGLEQHDALDLAHTVAEFRFLFRIDRHRAVNEHRLNVAALGVLALLRRKAEIVILCQPAAVIIAQTVEVPALVVVVVGGIAGDVVGHGFADHAEDRVLHAVAVEHLIALRIDDLALAVHDVVILQHVAADAEVALLDLVLGALDGAGQHLVLNRHILLDAEQLHHVVDALAAEQAHEVVLKREVEAGGAGVALTAGTSAQLVVNAAGLMPLGAEDKQTARLAHRLRLRTDRLFVFVIQFAEGRTGGENLLVVRLAVGGGFHDQLLGQSHTAHLRLGEIFRVAAQHNIRAASRHVGGDGDGADLARLGDDLRLLLVVLGVEDVVRNAAPLQHFRQQLGFFDGDGADQHRLLPLVALDDLVNNRTVFRCLGLIHHVGQILADHRAVRRNLHDVQPIDLLELRLLGHGGTGHTGQLLIQAEIVLERDGRERLALALHLDALLGFDRLMQPLVIAAAEHRTARELVHDQHLTVLDHVVDIALHDAARLDGLINVVEQRHVFGVHQVFDLEIRLRLAHTRLRQRGGACLFIDDIVGIGLVLLLLRVHLADTLRLQRAGKRVGARVQVGGAVALSRNDQRGTRFVDQDGVHLVDDGVVMTALHLLLLVDHHVVPQIVKAHLVVGAVGDVGGIGGAALLVFEVVHNQTDRQPQIAVDLAHPFTVAACQIVVDRDDMHALAGQRI